MVAKRRELSSLGNNELTETRTRNRNPLSSGTIRTRTIYQPDARDEPQESEDTSDRDSSSSFEDTDPVLVGRTSIRSGRVLDDSRSTGRVKISDVQQAGPQGDSAWTAAAGEPVGRGGRAFGKLGTPNKQGLPPGSNTPNASHRFRRIRRSVAYFKDALPHDDVQRRHASPPQDGRTKTRARYSNGISTCPRSAQVDPKCSPSNGRQPFDTSLDMKQMVERAALWAESGSMWLPYNGSYVQVVTEAVVDVVRHPQLSHLLQHHGVPIMIISSAGRTAAEAKASFRYACLECDGKWEFHQEQRSGDSFQHIIPVVKLQACRRGIPDTNDLILEDIDERMAKYTISQQVLASGEQHIHTAKLAKTHPLRRNGVAGRNMLHVSGQHAPSEQREQSTPPAQTHRGHSMLASQLKSNQAVAAQTPSQPACHQVVETPGLPHGDQRTSPTRAPREDDAQKTCADMLLQAHVQQFPNLKDVIQSTEGRHIIDMWYGSVAMQEYGAPSLFVLASAITGYPVEYYRSTLRGWPRANVDPKGWLWHNST